jgi:hypothetical protein
MIYKVLTLVEEVREEFRYVEASSEDNALIAVGKDKGLVVHIPPPVMKTKRVTPVKVVQEKQ